MFDISLLGTGGMMPLPNRWLTSMLIKFNGNMILVDCGEGTQITLKQLGWGFKNINAICFTHFHADHISGLPGMLLSIGNFERKNPLTLIGPKGLEEVVNSLRVIAPILPYDLEFIEIDINDNNEIKINDFIVKTCHVEHELHCLAYSFETNRPGKFNFEKASKLGIPKNLWSVIQRGESVVHDGVKFEPEMVVGENRNGFKVSYCTDSRPIDELVDFIKKSNLFICEGMYADDEKIKKAEAKKHMMFKEAAILAKKGHVDELWLTHFSPALENPHEYLDLVKDLFENVKIGHDRITKTLVYND